MSSENDTWTIGSLVRFIEGLASAYEKVANRLRDTNESSVSYDNDMKSAELYDRIANEFRMILAFNNYFWKEQAGVEDSNE